MIEREGGKLIWICDTCDEEEAFDKNESFHECWDELKRQGWRTKKIGDEWVHGCPRCGV